MSEQFVEILNLTPGMDDRPLSKKQMEAIAKWTCKFGKHKGQTFGWIVQNDADYSRWLAGVVYSKDVAKFIMQHWADTVKDVVDSNKA